MRVPRREDPSEKDLPIRLRFRLAAVLLLAGLGIPPAAFASSTDGPPAVVSELPRLAGRSLDEALGLLQARGLRLVYNSRVVPEHLRVAEEPRGEVPLEILVELLRPHGLAFRAGPGGRLVIVVAEGPAVGRGEPPAEGAAPPEPAAEPLERIFDRISVTPSQVTLKRLRAAEPLTLEKDLLMTLPGLADDPLGGLKAIPGVAAADTSARMSVRGGPADGTLLLLDGVELLEPFHLQDFGGASSIVAPEVIQSIDVMTGSVPAQLGGRTGGVVDMHSLEPPPGRRTRLGVGLLDSHLLHSSRLAGDGGYWLGLARLGTFDPALRYDGRRDQPTFWDVFAKLETRVGTGHLGAERTLTVRALHADDHLNFESRDPEGHEDLESRYQSSYLWGSLSMPLSRRLFSETGLSLTLLDRRRNTEQSGPQVRFALDDRRRLGRVGLAQAFDLQLPRDHAVSLGFDARLLDARFRYSSEIDNRDPLVRVRTVTEAGAFSGSLREEQLSLYAADLFRPLDDLTLQVGLRFESYTLTDRSDLTPRLALAWWLEDGAVLRLSWGSFVQNQRPYELQLTDGETEFASGERSEQTVLSYERPLARRTSLRLEAYRRSTSNPRPRFVNLFEPRTAVPEVQSDRVRLAPEYSEAEGIEVLVRGSAGKGSWWLHYARARARDRLADGGAVREVPNPVDQAHSVAAHYQLHLGSRWRAGAVWRYHTGWPTTRVTAEGGVDDAGEEVVEAGLGPLFGERRPAYHRLDLRLSRSWRLSRGELEASLDLQNLYDRRNVRGYTIEFLGPPSQPVVEREERYWRGLFASFGISWEF